METVSITLPADLYITLYDQYGDKTTQNIVDILRGSSDVEPIEQPSFSYRPGAGTKTGRVWEIADELKAASGTAIRNEVLQRCFEEGLNMNTANTQYSKWKSENE
jgi:hypothetical protein